MRQIKEIIRLKQTTKLSNRKIAGACKVSPTTVAEQIEKFELSGLDYESIKDKPDDEILGLLNPSAESVVKVYAKPMADMNYLHTELKRKGVTIQLLWEEYREQYPDGYGRSQFAHHYHEWKKELNPTMRLNHKSGEKVFVDFSGDRPSVVDPDTGEISYPELFVGVMGASSYTFAIAVPNQKIESWIDCHIQMFDYFGGVPECVVPDNLKSGVTDACYYDPEVNPTYSDLADHYEVAVLPARPRKPQDKAKAENGVLIVQRRILAVLRDRIFFSISELNYAIKEELIKLNAKPMQHIGKSRSELFAELDKPVLKALPMSSFEIFSWKKATVGIDYHIELEKVYYSVPYTLIHKKVDVRHNSRTVDIFFNGRQISSHPKCPYQGKSITSKVHMPSHHSFYAEWSPERIRHWAEKEVGLKTMEFIDILMERRTHPEQGFRSSIGIINLAKKYGADRVENACNRAMSSGAYRYKNVKAILDRGMDKVVSIDEIRDSVEHDNIRGNNYYKMGDE